MKADLAPADLKLLKLILEKARLIETSFVGPTGFAKDPLFERALAELVVLIQSLSFSSDSLVQKQSELSDHLHPGMTPRHFLNFLLPIERLIDRSLRDEEILVTTHDTAASLRERRPLILVLDHLRSAFNVGSIYRMAETLRAEAVYLCGYTPGPEAESVRKTAMGTENLTETRRFDRVDAALAVLKEKGILTLALETSPQAKSLYEGSLPVTCAWVVGNERFGLDFHTLKLCDETRRIPLAGSKNSLNVAQALAIASFEWHRQHPEADLS